MTGFQLLVLIVAAFVAGVVVGYRIGKCKGQALERQRGLELSADCINRAIGYGQRQILRRLPERKRKGFNLSHL